MEAPRDGIWLSALQDYNVKGQEDKPAISQERNRKEGICIYKGPLVGHEQSLALRFQPSRGAVQASRAVERKALQAAEQARSMAITRLQVLDGVHRGAGSLHLLQVKVNVPLTIILLKSTKQRVDVRFCRSSTSNGHHKTSRASMIQPHTNPVGGVRVAFDKPCFDRPAGRQDGLPLTTLFHTSRMPVTLPCIQVLKSSSKCLVC